jgi:hypothetical protein
MTTSDCGADLYSAMDVAVNSTTGGAHDHDYHVTG